VGRIVANLYISLDGAVERPEEWQFPYYDDAMAASVASASASCTAFLMGRVQYEGWSAYWPGHVRTEPDGVRASADDFATFINAVPKYVVSTTLTEPTWSGTTVISGDVASQIQALKEREAGDVGMAGSATLVRWLLAQDLLDELHLLVHPLVVGSGQRLFEGGATHRLALVRHAAFPTGVLDLTYAPAT
jgi:dihydrofolate reductase